ncbi:hypothetical protein [Bradyrhizobium sp. LHD-71]|uniref:hypothetical protein n=1 Tax=Bradyrhizobium sp. LHD-71 TaxID=3072141 RepID=UPI00280F5EC3|nr:hypothetical protein [Bradyrhizobium sp. LHD-71]MDQ8728030.1 hypothetical protein [Bradyrhizobium sp. LHD-71]
MYMDAINGLPPRREQTVNQVGGDVAVQLMLMMLFACVSSLADDPDAFQKQLRDKLLDLTNAVALPAGSPEIEQEIRAAARTVISNVFTGAGAIQFPKNPLDDAPEMMADRNGASAPSV